ncbi:putative general secretory pathway protein E [Clostridiales bacterium oral taxon 876 str. F0540]|nr:putative general secretory pathway protein E [Clostridiales bacterium oral taxon 876 str. F0540]
MKQETKDYKERPELINLKGLSISSKILDVMPRDVMYKYCAVPLQISENYVVIAMGNTEDKDAILNISCLLNKKIEVVPADNKEIYTLINSVGEKQETDLILEQLERNLEKSQSLNRNDNRGEINLVESSPIVRLTNSIIVQAINIKASDIHIEPFEENVIVRNRIDGILYENIKLQKDIYTPICSRIKLQAGMDISEKRIPQDGKLQFEHNGLVFDLRVSTLPTIHGEKVVIRILYKQEKLQSLKDLGFSDFGKNSISNSLKNNHGIILVTGPTGSGKTTTLYSMLEEIDKYNKNIVTIEDPVEIQVPFVNQVNVNTRAGLNFASGLRSILRQDPNIIMIGEIRDEETAQIAVRAAITGHLVLSTLHTNDAASSVIRLIDMGVPNYLAADSLLTCIAQRLVRKICNFCKTEYKPNIREKHELMINDNEVLYKGKGCAFCKHSGYSGRTVVYEIMSVDDSLREYISKGYSADRIRQYNYNKNMTTLRENCIDLVKSGVTSFDEFLRICNAS